MSEKSTSNERSPEYQIGGFGEEISGDTTLGDESEFIEFDYETAAVFKRLADDIYESTEAGIREPLQNSITAVKRAINEKNLDKNDGVIKIEAEDGDQVKLTIRDNGIGIRRNVLKEVLAVIGRSQNRDDGELSGKYGMGFLACYKLVGVRGGFLMYSNSRETDDDPIKGIWKPGGFEIDSGDELPDRLTEDDYGTLLDFTLKESVDIEQVREWIEKHSKWSSVPIIYTEYDSDGKEISNDEFGDNSLKEYHSDVKSICIESDYFTAVCSPKADSRTLLINSPLSRNGVDSVHSLNWRFDIRLKNENGVVVKGPNEGLQPVNDERYNNMESERRDVYVRESDLSSEDVRMPEPTGTRDTLESRSEFWDYLCSEFQEKYKNTLKDIMDKIDGKESYLNLSTNEQLILDDGIDRLSLMSKTNKKTRKSFKNEFGVDVDNELIGILRASKKNVKLVSEGSDARKASRKNSSSTSKQSVLEVHNRTDGDVYMGATLNQEKMDAVWDDSEENSVVRVDSSDDYEKLEDIFGWRKLKDVKKMLDELNVSEEIVERLQSKSKGTKTKSKKQRNAERDIEERHLTVHQKDLNRSGFTVEEIQDRYDGGDEYLVLFPSNTDKNLSDHKKLKSAHVGIANSIVKVSDYLSDCENVFTIEEWYDRIENKDIKTNKGDMKVKEAVQNNEVIFHVVGEDMIDVFREDAVIEEMETVVRDTASHNSSYGTGLNTFSVDNTVYIPVTPSELDQLRIHAESTEYDIITMEGDLSFRSIGASVSPVDSDIYWYAWARLPRWRDTKEIDILSRRGWRLNPDWVWLIDRIARSDYEIKSVSGLDIEPPEEVLQFRTNNGYLTVREIIDNYSSAVVHVLPLETVDAFRTEGVDDDALNYIIDNADTSSSFSSGSLSEKSYLDTDDIVYIPVTKSECEDLANVLDNPEDQEYTLGDSYESCSFVSVHGEMKLRDSPFADFYIESDTVVYAYSRLPESISDATVPIDNHGSIDELSEGGLEFIETMASVRSEST